MLNHPNQLDEARSAVKKFKKQSKWSHQQELEEAVGKQIRIIFPNDELATATLLAADQFTLKYNWNGTIITIFKHAIVGYTVL